MAEKTRFVLQTFEEIELIEQPDPDSVVQQKGLEELYKYQEQLRADHEKNSP